MRALASTLTAALVLTLAAPAAAAAEFSILSVDPPSGTLSPVPGGDAATASALGSGNSVRTVVLCDLPVVQSPHYLIPLVVRYSTVPSTAPTGRTFPKLVLKPAGCTLEDAAHAGPQKVTFTFGFACPTHAVAETQIVAGKIVLSDPLYPANTRFADLPGGFVVKCPQPVANVPHDPKLMNYVGTSPKKTPVSPKKP